MTTTHDAIREIYRLVAGVLDDTALVEGTPHPFLLKLRERLADGGDLRTALESDAEALHDAHMDGWKRGYAQAVRSLTEPLAVVDGWIDKNDLQYMQEHQVDFLPIWQKDEGQPIFTDGKPVTVVVMERKDSP